jgi:hypothetical protein
MTNTTPEEDPIVAYSGVIVQVTITPMGILSILLYR